MAIKNLELRARVVVEGFWHGLHRSPYHGFSVEFSEYRQYSPGDDPRYLDWRLYARSDRRKFHVPCPACNAWQELRFFPHTRGEFAG